MHSLAAGLLVSGVGLRGWWEGRGTAVQVRTVGQMSKVRGGRGGGEKEGE